MNDATRAAEMAARDSYGRLLAFLAKRTHDLAAAEDALSDAFLQALTKWPERGVPQNPDAWLMTVARNRLTDAQRRSARFPTEDEIPDMPEPQQQDTPFPDERLSLLMVCAHPAIAADLHTPLMLQTVLGMEAKAIASLFMISPAALAKRLVRAKAKIKDTAIPFAIPDAGQLPMRSAAIFEAVYALHAHDWLDPEDGLGEEALYLADLLCRLMPEQAEAHGLAALIAFTHARRTARIVEGVLVPIEQQNVQLWEDALTHYGNRKLVEAHRLDDIGRFQIEAAIQSVHMARKDGGVTDWDALNRLYHALATMAPSAGTMVAQAVVTANLHGAQAGLAALDTLESQIGTGFQPYWAARAEMLRRAGQETDALAAYEKAISLATDTPTIRFLKSKLVLH